MKKVPYTNTGKTIAHIDGKSIAPNDTREVDPTQIPGYQAEAPKQEPPADPVGALLKGKVKEITPAIPGLSDEDLDKVEAAEGAKKDPRVGVMKAVAEERLKRAEAKAAAEGGDGSGGGDDNPGDNTGTGETSEGDDGANSDNEGSGE